jgi:hypothetical protein
VIYLFQLFTPDGQRAIINFDFIPHGAMTSDNKIKKKEIHNAKCKMQQSIIAPQGFQPPQVPVSAAESQLGLSLDQLQLEADSELK